MQKHPRPNMESADDVLGARILALILDGIVLFVVSIVLTMIMGSLILSGGVGPGSIGIISLAFLVVTLAYTFLLEGLYGWTPGKAMMGLVVVKEDGSNCTIGSSVVRNLLRIVDILPALYIVGLGAIFVSDTGQRVGDMAASTVVVKQA